MKILACLLFLGNSLCFAQSGVRVDPVSALTIASNTSGALPPVLALPYAQIALCNAPAFGTPCTNFATAYTDATLQTACPLSQQVVLAGTASCGNQADGQGNFGFWLSPGQYLYTITWRGTTFGPYPITAGASVLSLPVNYATSFNFAPIAVTTQLAGGSPALLTIPCPAGITASKGKQYLYVSGGVGTAESVLLTSSSCSAGQVGTLGFTPANNHTGTWYLSSATAGITEAEYALPAVGGEVYLPHNTYALQAPIPYMQNVVFEGEGTGSVLVPASCAAVVFDANVPGNHPNNGLVGFDDNVQFRDFLIDAHTCANTNTVYGIRELLPGGATDTQGTGLSGVRVDRVICNNVTNCIYMQRAANLYSEGIKLYANSRVIFTDTAAGLNANNGHNSININFTDPQSNYYCLANNCAGSPPAFSGAQFLCQSCEGFTMINGNLTGLRSTYGTGQGYIEFDGGEGLTITDTVAELCDVCVAIRPISSQGVTYYPDSIILENFSPTQAYSYGVLVQDGTGSGASQSVTAINIIGGQFTDSRPEAANTVFIYLGQYSQNVIVDGAVFWSGYNFGESGPANWTGVYAAANASYLTVSNSTFKNIASVANTTYGLDLAGNNNYVSYSNGNTFQGVEFNLFDAATAVTAASTISILSGRPFYTIVGTTPIATINTCSSTINTDTYATFILPPGAGFTNTGNVSVTPFTAGNGGALTVFCNGFAWKAVSQANY